MAKKATTPKQPIKPQIERGAGMTPAGRIGERLIAVLAARRLTGAAACLKAGLSRDTARNLIRGRAKEPRPSMLGQLADALEVDIRVLTCELPMPQNLQPFPPRPTRAKRRRSDAVIPADSERVHLDEFSLTDPDRRMHMQPKVGLWSLPPDVVSGRGVESKDLVVVRSPEPIPELGIRRRDRLLVDTSVTFTRNGYAVGLLDGVPWAGKISQRRVASDPDDPLSSTVEPSVTPTVYGVVVAVLKWLD